MIKLKKSLLACLVGACFVVPALADITLYTGTAYSGRSETVSGPVSNLRDLGLDNMVSSLRVSSGSWEVCTGPGFRGGCEIVDSSVFDLGQIGLDNDISSIRPHELHGPSDPVGGYPTAPADAGERAGLVLYEHPGFNGTSFGVNGEIADLDGAYISEEASSVRVRSGAWLLCSGPRFTGRCEIVEQDEFSLGMINLNDAVRSVRPHVIPISSRRTGLVLYANPAHRGAAHWLDSAQDTLDYSEVGSGTSSLRILSGDWEVCSGTRFSGQCAVFTSDALELGAVGFNDRIRSVRPYSGRGPAIDVRRQFETAGLILFTDPNERGRGLPVMENIGNLRLLDFNDTVSSVRLNFGRWELCSDPDYRGRCRTIDQSIGYTRDIELNDNLSSVRRVAE